jgi:predicted PurR-regulated permease PerM
MDEPVRPDPAAAPDEAGPSPGSEGPEPDIARESTASDGPPVAGAGPSPRPLRRLPPLTPRVAAVIVGAIVLATVLYMGRDALRPFVVGLVLAYLLDLPVERMARRRIPRWASVLIVYAVFAVLFVQAIRIIFRPLADEIATFIREFPKFTAQVADLYAHMDLPPGVREAIDEWLANLGQGVGGINPGDLLPVVTGIAGLLGSIVGYVIIPVWVFYLIKDRPALVDAAEKSVPAEWREDLRSAGSLVLRVFGQWLRGQVFLGLVVGVATFIGLMALSVVVNPVFGRFAVLLSVIAGVLELLPIIGPIIAAIPAVILGLTVGVEAAVAAVLLYLLIQQVENNVLVPKIQGDAVELHPSIVMLALVMGGAIGGLLGAILALPVTAAARDLFRYAFHRLDDPPATPEEAVARIRARPTVVEPSPEPADPAGEKAGA